MISQLPVDHSCKEFGRKHSVKYSGIICHAQNRSLLSVFEAHLVELASFMGAGHQSLFWHRSVCCGVCP